MRKPRINIFGGKEHPRAFSEGRGVIFQQHKEHPGVKFPRGVDLFFFVRGTPRTHTHTQNIQFAADLSRWNPRCWAQTSTRKHSRSRRRAVGKPCAVRRRGRTFKKQKKGGWGTLRRSPPGDDTSSDTPSEAKKGRAILVSPESFWP